MMSNGLVAQADAIRLPFADQSVDLVMGSPPYCDARTYGIGAQRDCQPWIDWMLDVTAEALRVSRGAVIWVAAGVTRDRNYWPACEGLMYEWWKRGGSMYRPCYWQRHGVPGSGGDQWFKAVIEYCMCFKRSGRLVWTDNTAMGHKPRWGQGGEMSYRTKAGGRVNQWGETVHATKVGDRTKHGTRQKRLKPSHVFDGSVDAIANPGNLIKVVVGGGVMGDSLCHENEAPYPEKLAEFFVRSLCPPSGSVLDPFSGSGTTAKVAAQFGRIGIGTDIRASQTALTTRRLGKVQRQLFA